MTESLQTCFAISRSYVSVYITCLIDAIVKFSSYNCHNLRLKNVKLIIYINILKNNFINYLNKVLRMYLNNFDLKIVKINTSLVKKSIVLLSATTKEIIILETLIQV